MNLDLFERKHKVAERLTQVGAENSEFAFEFHGLQTWGVFDGEVW